MEKNMNNMHRAVYIIIADDDEDYFFLVKEALKENGVNNHTRQLRDGEELLDYLLKRGRFLLEKEWFYPEMILLDLNMPRKGGIESLEEIKGNPSLKQIPVIIFTASDDREAVRRCFDLGADAYIVKPDSFKRLEKTIGKMVTHFG
jgi:CheY-like chemotaxis protein